MKVKVNIDGKCQVFDLSRVRWSDELEEEETVIAFNPDTRHLCLAEVSFDLRGALWLTKVLDDIAPYRWRVSKRSLRYTVYKINK